ncbi:PAS domain-containing protein [Daejeonella sp.]|uniref:PAS domain-containing protein n=1 Tax=Daejeonella sp. TaxID=2805397 RepID=UPI003983109C
METPDYNALFDNSPELLLIIDKDLTIISATQAYLKAVNKLNEAISGKNIFDALTNPANDTVAGSIDDIKASLKRVLQHKTTDTLSIPVYTTDKPEVDINQKRYRITHSPTLDKSGNIKYITQRLEDITEVETLKSRLELKTNSLEQISVSEKLFYMMLMNSPFAFCIMKGEDLVITFANNLMKDFWGKGRDVEGKTLLQVLPEVKDQPFPGMILSVLKTGTPLYANEILARLQYNGILEDRYFNIIYQPYHEEDGAISGVTTTAFEVTEMVLARKRIEESEERFRNLVEKFPSPVCILKGEDMVLKVANEAAFKIWNVDKGALGKPFLEIIPEMKGQPFMGYLLDVYGNGVTHYGTEEPAYFIREDGKPETIYFNFVYQPYREDDGIITGVMVSATDVTVQVTSRKKIEESEHRYREMIFSSPSLIAILKGKEMIIDIANDAILETWGKGKNVSGKPLLAVLPELVGHGFDELFHKVYTTGQPHFAYEMPVYLVRNGQKELSYYTFIYQAQRDTEGTITGVAVIGREVTPEAQLNQKIKGSEEQFRRLVMQAPVAICVLRGEDYVIETINEPMIEMWDRTMEEALNKPAFDVLTEFRDQGLKQLLDQVYQTGENIVINELPLSIKRNGALTDIFVKFVYEPLREADGTISGVMALAHEITDQVIARKKIEAQALMHQDMLMTAPGFVCTLVGPTHIYTLVNDQYQMLFGKRKIKGKPIMVALPELEGQGFDTLLDKVYTTGETYVGFDIPITLARDENLAPEVCYFNFSYQPMYDENKQIYSILVFGYEVTEIVIAKKRIEEKERLFRQLLDTMPQIAWTSTVDGKITFYNQRWYDYTGLDQEQTNRLGFKNVINPNDLRLAVENYRSICETNEGGDFQILGKGADGSYRWHLIRLTPIKNDKGEAQLWIGTATDIQELKILQQQKDDFISIASHELKTPVTSLKASLQLLNRIKDNPSNIMFSKLIEQANKSLDKVSVLMDDLLNASVANEGQLHIKKQSINLYKVIEECCPHVRVEGIYTIITEGDMNVEVYADPMRIDQVVSNFVNNAIKYASGSKVIRIFIEKVSDMAKVSIVDTGTGISPDKLLHLFDRFYRVDSSGSQYSGLGLGLYISAEIIKKHNGNIGVDSELGKGSTFWFTLPLA